MNAFCWSKMGTEAGQSLSDILKRKEIERIANDGLFVWGIGNSLGDSIRFLMETNPQPKVLFSKMLSSPKNIDVKPEKVYLWLSYTNEHGEKIPLPKYSLVTSRANTEARGLKKKHYALLCKSQNTITTEPKKSLYKDSLVNLLSGKKVGASQVTSVVKTIPYKQKEGAQYEVSFEAELMASGQVVLSDFVVITNDELQNLYNCAKNNNVSGWKQKIIKLKSKKRMSMEVVPKTEITQSTQLSFAM